MLIVLRGRREIMHTLHSVLGLDKFRYLPPVGSFTGVLASVYLRGIVEECEVPSCESQALTRMERLRRKFVS